MNKQAWTIMALFMTIWSAFTIGFDGFIGYTITKQIQSQSFPTVVGVITSSEVSSHYDSENGTTYKANISFGYNFNGRDYHSNQWRYSAMGSSDQSYAREAVKEFPEGRDVKVYVNPDKPEDAVLRTGVEGMDMFMLLFLTPFNLIMLTGWFFGGRAILRKRFGWFQENSEPGLPPGVQLIQDPQRTRLVLEKPSALGQAVGAMFISSFASIFIVGFGIGFNISMMHIAVIWGVILGLSLLAAGRVLVGLAPTKALEIDTYRSVLKAPHIKTPQGVLELGRDQIDQLEATKRVGNSGKNKPNNLVKAVYQDGQTSRSAVLHAYNKKNDAKQLVAWLRKQLDLPAG